MRDRYRKHKRTHKKSYKPAECKDTVSFRDCELAILRQAVEESEKEQGAKVANSPEVTKIIQILEAFLVRKKLICYGGTAINNILPKFAQFYDRNVEIPDYDFFSMNALADAKELADIYYQHGYDEVEAKSGMHPGTFKVYVQFLPVADITYLDPVLFESLTREAITIAGIRYAPPNYLRMGMFLELSRPNGDVSRWEKVLKRINLLNKFYPLTSEKPCNTIDFQRHVGVKENKRHAERIYYLVRDSLIDQGVVFLGGYGTVLYSKYMSESQKRQIEKIPDFEVLAETPLQTVTIAKDRLHDAGYKHVKLIQHTGVGEVVPPHIEMVVNGDTVAFVYEPIACHSYNTITIDQKEVNVATIDTMLSFYLAFIYADKPYYDRDRILCMAMYLFHVEQKNRLEQKGLLKRFSLSCYGKQETVTEIRENKAQKYEELKGAKKSDEYEKWFLKYDPAKTKRVKRGVSASTPKSIPSKTREIRSLTRKRTIRKTPEDKDSLASDSLASESVSPDSLPKVSPKRRRKSARNPPPDEPVDPYARREFRFW